MGSQIFGTVEGEKYIGEQIKEVCKRYWKNSSVRRYYVDICMKKKEYDHVLQILDECILLDKQYRGLISEYSEKNYDEDGKFVLLHQFKKETQKTPKREIERAKAERDDYKARKEAKKK